MRYEAVEKKKSEKKYREKAYELWCNCDSVAEFKLKLATMMPEMSVFPFLVHYFWRMQPTMYYALHIISVVLLFFFTGGLIVAFTHLDVFWVVIIACGVPSLAEWIWEVKVSRTLRELTHYEFNH